MKINIVYWSGTGNTLRMAELIRDGAGEAGAQAALHEVTTVKSNPEEALNCDVLALGCPSMGSERLEIYEFDPFMESIEKQLTGKRIALFGSYCWGDGLWMRMWDKRMKKAGAFLVTDSLIVKNFPEGEDEERCKAFGGNLTVNPHNSF